MKKQILILVCAIQLSFTVATSFSAGKELTIMPMGDSITAGYNVGMGGYRNYLRDKLIKNGMKIDFVGRSTDQSGKIPDPEHEGYSGFVIKQIAGKADEVLQTIKPDIILLFAGSNDVRVNEANDKPSDPNYYKTAPNRMEDLLKVIKTRSPGSMVIVGTLMPFAGNWAAREDAAKEFNGKIAKIVSDRKAKGDKIYLVDFRKTITEKDLADGLHPTAEGYEKMAQAWADAIGKINSK